MRKATYTTVGSVAAVLLAVAAAWPILHGSSAAAREVPGVPGAARARRATADTGTAGAAGAAAARAAKTSGTPTPASPGWYPQPIGAPIQGHDSLSAAQVAIQLAESATQGPAQPIPFNHHFHTTNLKMSCEYCHTNSRHSEVAIMPPLATCIGCHRIVGTGLAPIDTLRAYWQRQEPVPWVRVYKIAEFVQFKHEPHLRNDLQCQTCHGPVQDMDRVYEFQSDTIPIQSLTMGWCLRCHRQKPQPTDVATEYKLVRQAAIPANPGGTEKPGLYPMAISEQYAAHRAPLDCTTCHY
ncbi:MAG: cytochrome c3 family protein [Candidatus Palauibacterales bacterium]|nr:cytochrome c3 family protein [Candidatus Palauibacterales bacterium]MDP2529210.1 cytochrome c3 family protein [Candidatus Palauibacterales bacterium]MDP2583663.1 cytochrome c3 family protein [Candidatus Palauibacterales bacterium]